MTSTRRAQLSSLFHAAWRAKRAEPGRSFASCLREAWRYAKGAMKAAAGFMRKTEVAGGKVRLSPSLIASPIRRAAAGRRHGRREDFQAAYLTARVGY